MRRWRSFYNYLLWRILLSIVTSNIQNLFRNLFRVTGILDTVSKMSDIENNELQFWKWPIKLGGHWNRIGQLLRLTWTEYRLLWLSKPSMPSDLKIEKLSLSGNLFCIFPMKYRRKSADGRTKISCSRWHRPDAVFTLSIFHASCRSLDKSGRSVMEKRGIIIFVSIENYRKLKWLVFGYGKLSKLTNSNPIRLWQSMPVNDRPV